MANSKKNFGLLFILDMIVALLLLYMIMPSPWTVDALVSEERSKSLIWGLYIVLLVFTVFLSWVFKGRILACLSGFSWKAAGHDLVARFHITRRDLMVLAAFLIVGGCLRMIGINWGITHIFQADEKKLVKAAIKMAEEGIPYHYYFSYPNEFLSKIAAVIIIVWAKISGMEIEPDAITCYFIFRGCVAAMSTGLIATTYLIGNYFRRNLGVISAGLVTIFPPFINYAKQVTGDISVVFFASLVMICSFYYLEKGEHRHVITMTLFAALATLEKWHGGVLCIYVACIIVYRCMRERDLKKLFFQGALALLGWVGWIFMIAPNVIWDIHSAVEEFLSIYTSGDWYVRPNDIWIFFIKCFFSHGGVIGLLLVFCGFVFLLKDRNEKYFVLLAGLLNWLVMSAVMNRIFERWGMECYLTLLIIQAMGIYLLWSYRKKALTVILVITTVVVSGTYVTGCIRYVCIAAYSRQDTRLIGEQVFEELGITKDNSIYDYYTPFSPGGIRSLHGGEGQKAKSMNDYIVEENGEVYVTEADKIFAVASEYRGAVAGEGSYALLEANAPSLGNILSFHPDLFHAECGMGDWRTIEFVSCYRNWQEICGILRGEAMGPVLKLYDISAMKVKVEEE